MKIKQYCRHFIKMNEFMKKCVLLFCLYNRKTKTGKKFMDVHIALALPTVSIIQIILRSTIFIITLIVSHSKQL